MEIKNKKENFALGVVGALIGGILGAASIILLAQAGVVSALSGVVLAFCTLKGFELLGGKLDKKAIAVCIVIMLAVPYLADRVSWAIIYCQALGKFGIELPFGDSFKYLYEMLELDELMGDYIKNLLLVYGFTALGGFTIIKQAFKQTPAAPVKVVAEAEVVEAPAEEPVETETPVAE